MRTPFANSFSSWISSNRETVLFLLFALLFTAHNSLAQSLGY